MIVLVLDGMAIISLVSSVAGAALSMLSSIVGSSMRAVVGLIGAVVGLMMRAIVGSMGAVVGLMMIAVVGLMMRAAVGLMVRSIVGSMGAVVGQMMRGVVGLMVKSVDSFILTIFQLLMQYILNLTIGLVSSLVFFIIESWYIITSYGPPILSGLSLFFLVVCSSAAVVLTAVGGMFGGLIGSVYFLVRNAEKRARLEGSSSRMRAPRMHWE
jgi:hypothetical protein